MVEIPKGVWTQPLEIEQSSKEVHRRKTEALVMAVEEKEAPWYYDIMKFLELSIYRCLHVSLLILQNPLHVILQPLLVACSEVDVFMRNNVFCHLTTWPSFTNPAQDSICEHRGVEGTLITRSSLTLFKLP
ncbi:hypothetical protein SO802_017516 [Lithocarpus litseifolius]|uniref:Uncharacterized protein n=1 Tax=Lithocarpus litseifolius TaxID=425828 RepID=A0AAW2CIL7_9ROSI